MTAAYTLSNARPSRVSRLRERFRLEEPVIEWIPVCVDLIRPSSPDDRVSIHYNVKYTLLMFAVLARRRNISGLH